MAVLTSFWPYDVFVLLGTVFAAVYAYFRYSYKYWTNRGFPHVSPTFPMGNFAGMNRTKNMDFLLADLYFNNAETPFIGAYLLTRPIIVIRDLELAKNIMVKDFASFHDRMNVEFKHDTILRNLFMLNGKEWRNLRIKLTPTFTSGKMKIMFQTLLGVGQQLVQVLDEESAKDEVEIKDILSRFTTDVIGSVAFGIDVDSLKNPDNEFRRLGNAMTKPSLRQGVVFTLVMAAPELADKIKLKFMPKHLTDFFFKTVSDTIDYRNENNVKRNDFMDLIIQLMNKGYVQDADNPQNDGDEETQQKFNLDYAVAQAFIFFAAGFETSSSAMQFALYELALNPELQSKVQEELDEAFNETNGELNYDVIMHLDLLDRVVAETLRKYPAAGVIFRKCTKEYQIPDSDHKILEGETVWLPVYGYHHDPKYYPEPEKFDPDRFLPEAKTNRPDYAYLPFGEGPRSCIGNRFGLMQVKTGLALTLLNFSLSVSKNTPIPMVFDPKMSSLTPKGLLCLKITRRKQPIL